LALLAIPLFTAMLFLDIDTPDGGPYTPRRPNGRLTIGSALIDTQGAGRYHHLPFPFCF